jgi:hypothetical protein
MAFDSIGSVIGRGCDLRVSIVFDESAGAFAHDAVSDGWKRGHQVPELRAGEHQQRRARLGCDGRGSPSTGCEEGDFADERAPADDDMTVVDGDVEFAVDDDEAFTADVALMAEDAARRDGRCGGVSVDLTECAGGAAGEHVEVAEAADGIGHCGEQHYGLLVSNGDVEPRVPEAIRSGFDCGLTQSCVIAPGDRSYDRAVCGREITL